MAECYTVHFRIGFEKILRIIKLIELLSLNHKILYNFMYVYFADHCGVNDSLAFTFRTLSDRPI